MRIRRCAAAGALATIVTLFATCGPPRADLINAELGQLIQTNTVIDMTAAFQGDWERVCLIRPYTAAADIETLLGFAWPDATTTGIDATDAATLIVFTADGAVSEHLLFERARGDFWGGDADSYCVPRSEARFEVVDPTTTPRQLVPASNPAPR